MEKRVSTVLDLMLNDLLSNPYLPAVNTIHKDVDLVLRRQPNREIKSSVMGADCKDKRLVHLITLPTVCPTVCVTGKCGIWRTKPSVAEFAVEVESRKCGRTPAHVRCTRLAGF